MEKVPAPERKKHGICGWIEYMSTSRVQASGNEPVAGAIGQGSYDPETAVVVWRISIESRVNTHRPNPCIDGPLAIGEQGPGSLHPGIVEIRVNDALLHQPRVALNVRT
jgi:hypothetical protein